MIELLWFLPYHLQAHRKALRTAHCKRAGTFPALRTARILYTRYRKQNPKLQLSGTYASER